MDGPSPLSAIELNQHPTQGGVRIGSPQQEDDSMGHYRATGKSRRSFWLLPRAVACAVVSFGGDGAGATFHRLRLLAALYPASLYA